MTLPSGKSEWVTVMDGTGVPRQGVLHDLFEAESERPEAVIFRHVDGEEWTVARLAQAARSCASFLASEGVSRGDRVAIMSQNDIRLPAWWYGIQLLGAVDVQVNAELRGPLLRHVLEDSAPTLMIAQQECRDVVAALGDVDLRFLDLDLPPAGSQDLELSLPVASDLASIMYTSGTTGPSKGAMLSFGYFSNFGAVLRAVYDIRPGDVLFVPLAFFHIDAHVMIASCLQAGATLALTERFSASRFWQHVATSGATHFCVVGAMFDAIAAHPKPDPSVASRVRCAFGAPISEKSYAFFEDELGIPLVQMYGQTETYASIYATAERQRRGSAGLACAGHDVAVVDAKGRELPPGETGEIVSRPRYPDMMMLGYWRRPEATVEATRDLWWHSGDAGHFDEDGFLYFDGRLRDSLRRRGENVSAWELESTIRQAQGIADAVAVPVPDEIGGEDDIKVFVVLEPGAELDAESLFVYCEENLARFAVPRYIEVIDEADVVRSPGTGVIQKHRLPGENGPRVIDRQALTG